MPFAGYDMPLNYPGGILAEHLHTRESASLFDVSHMGQIDIRADTATAADTDEMAAALESLMPTDVMSLRAHRQRYTLLTNDDGGIVDDAMLQNLGGHFTLVVNAARKQHDVAHLGQLIEAAGGGVRLELANERALLALQGPAAAAVFADLGNDLHEMTFMAVRQLSLAGARCVVARSGYTGEDGFEVSLRAADAERVARALLDHSAVKLAGLGARDSLRLEAGLCLYGSDIDSHTTPAEAGLSWAIGKARRNGGERAGGFPGADVILAQTLPDAANIARRRVGLLPAGRAPVRASAPLLDADGNQIGKVTSGGFSPSLRHPIAMGYVPPKFANAGTKLQAEVRGKRMPLTVAALPFVAHNFYR